MLNRLIALCLCLFLCQWGAARATAQETSITNYILAYGDVLQINLLEQPGLINPSTHLEHIYIRPDGKISLPLIGEVQAAGVAIADLTAVLTRAYSKYFKTPHVTVNVGIFRPPHTKMQVAAIGQVTRPGMHEFIKPPTVMEVIAAAGGFTDKANRSRVMIYAKHTGGQVTTIDLEQLIKAGKHNELVLGDGDTVEVAHGGGIDWVVAAPILLGVATLVVSILALSRR